MVFDQTAATFGLEPRYPFFDRRFVEFCLALPFKQKLQRRLVARHFPPSHGEYSAAQSAVAHG